MKFMDVWSSRRERAKKNIAEIIEVMEILAANVEDENGYLRMADLRNNIQE